ncbi:hypothetical protein GCM10023238_29210 [Streptomyces heliomycini]
MPNSPITALAQIHTSRNPGQTSPPNGWGRAPERVDRGRMYLSNCPLQQVNRTRNLDGAGPECGQNSTESGQVGPHKGGRCREEGSHFGYIQSARGRNSVFLDQWIGSAFPNSTAPNPMELPPPLLSWRGNAPNARSLSLPKVMISLRPPPE